MFTTATLYLLQSRLLLQGCLETGCGSLAAAPNLTSLYLSPNQGALPRDEPVPAGCIYGQTDAQVIWKLLTEAF